MGPKTPRRLGVPVDGIVAESRAAVAALRSFAMIARSFQFALLVAVSASVGASKAEDAPAKVVVGPPGHGPVVGPALRGPVVVGPAVNGSVVNSPVVVGPAVNGHVVAGPVDFTPAYQPHFSIEAGVNFLSRSSPGRKGLIGQLVNLDTDEVLSSVETKDINYRFEAGPDLTFRFHGNNGSFDLRWLGLDSWSDRATLETEDADPIGTTTPVSPFAFVLEEGAELGGIRARAHSYFQSFQAGRTTIVSENECYILTNYVGFRYIYFRDAIEIERAGTVDNEGYGWGSNNNLVGGEVGLDIGKHYGFLTLGAKARVGGYANFADLNGSYDITIGSTQGFAPIDFQVPSDDFRGFTGVFDLGVYSTIHANRHFSLKFGYDVIMMTNLVMATENMQPSLITVTQVPDAFPIVTPGQLNARGDSFVVVHGFVVTGEVTW
jgi:hypothetical protein